MYASVRFSVVFRMLQLQIKIHLINFKKPHILSGIANGLVNRGILSHSMSQAAHVWAKDLRDVRVSALNRVAYEEHQLQIRIHLVHLPRPFYRLQIARAKIVTLLTTLMITLGVAG